LGLGHLVTDLNQGALLLLLPVLKAELRLTNAAAALLVTVATVSSSLVQPLFGWLTDRWPMRALLPLGCLCAGLGVGLTGVAGDYAALLPLVALSGLGVAAYHPEAARNANVVSGDLRATGMSIYSVGGNLGLALGTLVITPFLLRLGRPGALAIVPLAALMAVVLWRSLPRIAPASPSREGQAAGSFTPMVLLLLVIVTFRSWAQMGFATFLPLWYSAQHRPLAESSWLVFLFLFAGAVGTLLGGPIADRWGRKPVVLVGMLATSPLLGASLVVPPWLAWLPLVLAGAAVVSTFVVTLVMAQEYMPGSTGTAAGLMVGFALGMGGLGVGALGHVADAFGLELTLKVVVLLPLAGVAGALFLRDTGRAGEGLRVPA
jgi:FSR family fosmidomycin resistance protein-like MFS transporter